MKISSPEELKKAVNQASVLLQAIHDYCEDHGKTYLVFPDACVRFPNGFIRRATSQRARLPFITDQALKSNIAYTMILSDAILWLYLRTDIFGTAKQMLTKLYVFLMGSISESITKDYLTGICGGPYKARTKDLLDKGIISAELQQDLDWLWDSRNRMHLFQLGSAEYKNEYDLICHMRCVATFRALLAALTERGALRPAP